MMTVGLCPNPDGVCNIDTRLSLKPWEKFIDRNTSRANQTPQSSPIEFSMIGYRKRRHTAFPCQNDVAAALADNLPAEALKDANSFTATDDRKRRH
jgi:hypothetical protein